MGFELLCIIFGILTFYIIFNKTRKVAGKVLGGPKGLPVLGSILEVDDENIHSKFTDYAEEYGEMCQVKLLFDTFVVLNSERMIRKCFGGERFKLMFNDRGELFYRKEFACNRKALSYVLDGTSHFHRMVRKKFMQALHAYGSGLQDVEKNVMTELSNLHTRIRGSPDNTFEYVSTIFHSISNIISIILIGEQVSEDETMKNMFAEEIHVEDFFLNSYVNFIMSVMPFFRYIPGRYRTEFRKAKSVKAKIENKFFHDVKDTHLRGKIRGIVDYFLEEQKQQMEGDSEVYLTDDAIIAQIFVMIDAGITTTWSLLSSTMLILLNYPQYQQKLQDEFDREIGRERMPSFKDRNNCTFFKAFEMETHRYLTVAPLMLPHRCNTNVELEGFGIQKNSTITGNIWYVHHNNATWGDPWTFRPERFLDEQGDLLPLEHELRKNLLPFGHGLRQCPGENFARTRYFLYVSSLLQRWSFEFPEGKHISCDPRLSENFNISVVIRPKSFYCRAKQRQ